MCSSWTPVELQSCCPEESVGTPYLTVTCDPHPSRRACSGVSLTSRLGLLVALTTLEPAVTRPSGAGGATSPLWVSTQSSASSGKVGQESEGAGTRGVPKRLDTVHPGPESGPSLGRRHRRGNLRRSGHTPRPEENPRELWTGFTLFRRVGS